MNPEEIAKWLHGQAKRENIEIALYPDRSYGERGWTYFPAAVLGGLDAYDEAVMLQKLEDAWNGQDLDKTYQIILVPTQVVNPAREAATRKVQLLMKRQHDALDAFASAIDEETAAAKFHDLRQQWEQALRELDQLAPRASQVA